MILVKIVRDEGCEGCGAGGACVAHASSVTRHDDDERLMRECLEPWTSLVRRCGLNSCAVLLCSVRVVL
jgi:hypothetical protein